MTAAGTGHLTITIAPDIGDSWTFDVADEAVWTIKHCNVVIPSGVTKINITIANPAATTTYVDDLFFGV